MRLALERIYLPPLGRVTDDTSVLTLRSLAFESLCRWQDGRVLPGLLAGWSVSADGRAWRFVLRAGSAFHDGVACTAAHVLATIRATLDGRDMFGMPWSYARYLAGAEIVADGADAIRITTPEPLADLPEILSEFICARADASGEAVVGTGLYRITRYVPHQQADLVTTDPARAPATIRAIAMPDAEARFAALRDDTADVALNLERCDAAPGGHGLIWGQAPNTLSVMAYLNGAEGLFRDPRARLAANLAVDRDAIIARLFHGLGLPATTIVSPFHLGMRAARPPTIPHDPARARALFAAAGVGAPILIRAPDHMPERAPAIAAMIAADLTACGCPATVEIIADRPGYARQVAARQIGDVALFDSSPHSSFRVIDDKISARSRGPWWQGHDDPALEALFRTAVATQDQAARDAAYGRCLARLQDNPPWLFLFHPVEVFAARAGLPPLALDHRGVLHFA
ncbi:ABC transporter substrate-binding protein [Falsiroseomonas sp. E2-1-a4]|uniref:ABC transporter substrate-binding protein n=1 Tax=Falsiroseomonas sp. E2-1-a4 TaxID=3239299 RepID=UPI003F2AA1F3